MKKGSTEGSTQHGHFNVFFACKFLSFPADVMTWTPWSCQFTSGCTVLYQFILATNLFQTPIAHFSQCKFSSLARNNYYTSQNTIQLEHPDMMHRDPHSQFSQFPEHNNLLSSSYLCHSFYPLLDISYILSLHL